MNKRLGYLLTYGGSLLIYVWIYQRPKIVYGTINTGETATLVRFVEF